MAFTLEITFGGLMMIVEEPHSQVRGCYLLLPQMKDHEPLLAFDGAYVQGGTPGVNVVHHIRGKSVDGSGIKLQSPNLQKLQKKNRSRFAMMSTLSGNKVVHPDWLTIAPTSAADDLLAARIRLPLLDGPMEPYGDLAKLSFGPPSPTNAGVWYAGRGRIRMVVKSSPIEIVYDSTTSEKLSDVSGLMELHVRNSAPASNPRPTAGSRADHMRGYWRFFDEPGKESSAGYPDFIVVEPGPDPTPDDPESALGRGARRGVDPAQCTIGSGCSSNDTGCP